ncbi:hypothetical protein TSA1_19870 [Bradyrhizobium nitroreducens]|uniref:Uncharacterized protein n=1 Tax=Bradyrhizobium nitroreducens TaxID=709803 RepID=A0A2M6UE08_9BRAD|nr:hypothetical protein [Bradyrhizobium nitroreducens]PIT02757.1 hypothetical protein TSA1_19870 [Bradyrhizobium nitroreducens]
MLTESTLGNTIRNVVSFLVGQRVIFHLASTKLLPQQKACIWREHLPDRFSAQSENSLHGSIWTTADIIYSLAKAASGREYFSAEQSSSIDRELHGFFQLAAVSLLAFDDRIRERANEEFMIVTESIVRGVYNEQSPLKRALRITVKDIQSYVGMPRSVVIDTDGDAMSGTHLEWGTANLAVTAVVCRSLREIIIAKLIQDVTLEEKAKQFLRNMTAYVSRADLSLLRTAIRQTEISEREADVPAFITNLQSKYQKLAKESTEKYGLIGLSSTINIAAQEISLGRYLREKLSIGDLPKGIIGCLWPCKASCGWSYSSQNHVTETDATAALPALEIIAYGLELGGDPGNLLKVAEIGMADFRRELAKKATNGKFEELGNDLTLSKKWSIEFLARNVVYLAQILTVQATAPLHPMIYECFECLYSALLIRTYQTTVENRTLPFEAIPQEFVSGNEFAHAPGVDIGFVTFALLIGRGRFNAQAARNNYRKFGEYFERIVGKGADGLIELPVGLPIFATMVDHVRARVITDYEEDEIAKALRDSKPNGLLGKPIVGAFLSSYSDPKGGEYTPKVYTWATAHALLALMEWSRQRGGENKIVEQLKEAQANLDHNVARANLLSDFSGYIAGYGYPATNGGRRFDAWNGVLLLIINFPLAAFVYFYTGHFFSSFSSHSGAELAVLATAFCAHSAFLIRQFRWLWAATVEIDEALKAGWCSVLKNECAMNNHGECAFGGKERCSFSLEGEKTLAALLRIYLGLYFFVALVVFAAGWAGLDAVKDIVLAVAKSMITYIIAALFAIVVLISGGFRLIRAAVPPSAPLSPTLAFLALLARSFRLFWQLLRGTNKLRLFIDRVKDNRTATPVTERGGV